MLAVSLLSRRCRAQPITVTARALSGLSHRSTTAVHAVLSFTKPGMEGLEGRDSAPHLESKSLLFLYRSLTEIKTLLNSNTCSFHWKTNDCLGMKDTTNLHSGGDRHFDDVGCSIYFLLYFHFLSLHDRSFLCGVLANSQHVSSGIIPWHKFNTFAPQFIIFQILLIGLIFSILNRVQTKLIQDKTSCLPSEHHSDTRKK